MRFFIRSQLSSAHLAKWKIELPSEEVVPQFNRESVQWKASDGTQFRIQLIPSPKLLKDGTEIVRQVKSHVVGYRDVWEGELDIVGSYRMCDSSFRDRDKKLVMYCKRLVSLFSMDRSTFGKDRMYLVKPSYIDRIHILIGIAVTAVMQDHYHHVSATWQGF